jgi:tetratricopeptide (TPR) repeat protein
VEMKRALTLDPLSTERMVFLGGSALLAGRLEEARMYLKMAIEIDPDLAVAHLYLGNVYDRQGKTDLAMNEFAEAYRLRGETEAETVLRQTYASAGYETAKKAALRQDIAFWKNMGKQRYVSAFVIARDYAQLGENEESLAWLERAYQERDMALLCLRADQDIWFSSVKNDPRFQAIVQKLGYPH